MYIFGVNIKYLANKHAQHENLSAILKAEHLTISAMHNIESQFWFKKHLKKEKLFVEVDKDKFYGEFQVVSVFRIVQILREFTTTEDTQENFIIEISKVRHFNFQLIFLFLVYDLNIGKFGDCGAIVMFHHQNVDMGNLICA